MAGPADYVFLPGVAYGEREIDFKYGAAAKKDEPSQQAASLQGFGEMGRWNHLDPTSEQSHRMGPAFFGKYNLGGKQAIVWNAALLFGLTEGSPDTNFRMQVEYEF